MKIIYSNCVTLNGGDYAILDSSMNVIRKAFPGNVEFIVYDNNAEIAQKYYPDVTYRKLIYYAHQRRSKNKVVAAFNKVWNKTLPKRILTAAKYKAAGNTFMTKLLLTKEEQKDLNNYASADLVISTGGTYLVENYPMHSRIFDYHFTLALKKPLIFFTQSLGPYKKPYNRQTLKEIFNAAKLIFVRDQASFRNLEDIGVDVSKAKVCSDVVFSDADPQTLVSAKAAAMRSPIRVAVSVREWSFFKGMSPKEGMENYNKSVSALCAYVCRDLGGQVTFISTCQGIKEYRDDSAAAKKIYETLPEDIKKNVSIDSDFHTPDQLKEIIKNFDLVISTRMHFAIQSLSMGVPVLPIAYEFKTQELFKKLIPEDLILDTDTLNPAKVVDVFKRYLDQLPGFRASLFEGVEAERKSAEKPAEYLRNLAL